MAFDPIEFANPIVQNLKPYKTGKPISELTRETGIEDVIKLASNENPLGISPKAKAAMLDVLSNLHFYPDGSGHDLKQAIAQKFKVESEQITLGNGSDEILGFIAKVFLSLEDESLISENSLATFSIVTRIARGKPVFIPSDNYKIDLSATLDAVTDKTKIIFIANPDNPTGTWVGESKLVPFLERLPSNIIVVLDEAYFGFVDDPDYPDSVALLQRFPNVIITRTFSKLYGLAGIRVGYSIASASVAELLNRVRLPFNVNTLAQAAAIAALNDEQHIKETIALNNAGLKQLMSGFEKLGLAYIPSNANFVTVDVGQDCQQVYNKLLQQGIIVRPMKNNKLPQHIRISVGKADENERALTALRNVL